MTEKPEPIRLSPEHSKQLGPDHIAAYRAAPSDVRHKMREDALYQHPELADAYDAMDTQLGKRRSA